MAYNKTVWSNGETALSDVNMNHIENGIERAHAAIDALETTVAAIILASHPVGSIEINTTGVNPGTYLGGTWVAWGSGRVPVGVNTSDTDFNTVEKTGGSKTVTLTTANLPSHSHTYFRIMQLQGITATTTGTYYAIKQNSESSVNTGNTGSGTAHSNVQPYITCYMWKRTA